METKRARRAATQSVVSPQAKDFSGPNVKALLKLAAARNAGEFWNSAQALLTQVAPSSIRWLCIRPTSMSTALVLLRETQTGAQRSSDEAGRSGRDDAALLKELFARHPAILHFQRRVGVPLVYLQPDQFSAAGQDGVRWPHLNQARFGVALAFWNRKEIRGVLLLHRMEEEGDFSPAEIKALRRLHPHLETALRRILAARAHEAQKHVLAGMLKPLPVAVVVCDWRLQIICESAEGLNARTHWEIGKERARALNRSARRALPPDLAAYCRGRIAAWEEAGTAARAKMEKEEKKLVLPEAPELEVTVSMFRQSHFPLVPPFFLLRFNKVADGATAAPLMSAARFSGLALLSASEREVAHLVVQGQGNNAISQLLGKSVHTVKAQMQSIFKKLEVTSRSKLTAKLTHGSLCCLLTSYFDLLETAFL